MTITQLQYILAVDTHKHFGHAAEACFVTQPTLSMQIQKLEDELGVVIFDRTKHPIETTTVGTRLIEQARVVISEATKLEQQAQTASGDITGEFRLGIIPTVAGNLLPRFLNAFKKDLGDVHLVIEELQTDQIIDALRMEKLDAGILATPLNEKGIAEVPLYYEPFMAFVPEGHRLAEDEFVLSSELDLDDLLLLNKGHCFRNSVVTLCNQQANKNRQFRLESGSFETLIRLYKLGYGMTLLPYLTAIDLPEEQQPFIKSVAEPTPSREVSIVFKDSNMKSAIIDRLAPIVRQSVPKRLIFEKNVVISPM